MFLSYLTGSFQVVDSTTLDDIVSFHHRKEEISDIKFSPGETFFFFGVGWGDVKQIILLNVSINFKPKLTDQNVICYIWVKKLLNFG